MHVKKGELHPEDVESYAEVMRHGKRKHVIAKGNPKVRGTAKKQKRRKKKWCPVPDCTTVCVRLDKHLIRKHKIKPGSVPYKIHVKEAKPYLGRLDLAEAPPTVPAMEDQPSTSTAAPCPPPHDKSSISDSENICPPTSFHSSSRSSSRSSSSSSSSSEGYKPSNRTNAMFFEDPKPSTDRQRWLCGFFKYLALPDAGHRKRQQRIQHASQMQLLLEAMAPEEDSLECLGEDNGDSVWLRWVEKHLQEHTKAPGTLASYLTSLQLLLTFVTGRKYDPQSMPPLSSTLRQTFADVIPALRGWRACKDSFTQDSQMRKYIAECDSLITIDEVKKLRTSKPFVDGATVMKKAEMGGKLSLREFTLVRDYLLCRLTLATGTRPGALNNVLLSDYETSRVSEGNRIMLVPKHKRTKDGPAMLGMDAAMQADMATYVTRIRPAFANPGVGQLFVKDDGDAFPEGTIGKRVAAFIQKSGVTSTRVGHTHLRKFISTQTHQQGTQDEGHTVEKVMSHGAVTKQRCYVRADLTTTASKAMNIIERVTGGSLQKPSKGKALTASVDIPLLPLSTVGEPLTEDQKLAISTVFAEELAKNIKLTKPVIIEKMARNTTLKDLTSCPSSIKRVANYLAYQQRRSPDRPHRPSSTVSTFSRVGKWVSALDETASRVSLREVWSAEDTATITEHLEQFKRCPEKATIEQLFDESDQLRKILEREGFSRCYEKVKNLMKKRRREEQ